MNFDPFQMGMYGQQQQGEGLALEKYGIDFTKRAREEKLGDSGVGKSAIVESIAQRIMSGDVPVSLAD